MMSMGVGRLLLLFSISALFGNVHQQAPSFQAKDQGKTTNDSDVTKTDQTRLTSDLILPHILSLVESINTRFSTWEVRLGVLENQVSASQGVLGLKIDDLFSQISTTKLSLEQDIKDSETRVTTKLNDVSSQLAAVEQRLVHQIGTMENRVSTDMSSLKEKVSDTETKLVLQMALNKESINSEIKSECQSSGSDITLTSIGYELSNFGRVVNNGIADSLDKVKEELNEAKKEALKLFRNTTFDLESGINQAAESLAGVSRALAQELLSGKDGLTNQFKNVTTSLQEAVNQAKSTLLMVGLDMGRNVSDSLNRVRDTLASDRKDSVEKLENITGVLVSQIETVITPLSGLKDEIISNVQNQGLVLQMFTQEMHSKLSNVSDQLFREIDAEVDVLNTYAQSSLELQLLSFNKTSSLCESLVNTDATLESCRKGMNARPASDGFPYYLVYGGNESFLCDTATNFGGWILIQYRANGNTQFYRGWEDYKAGFGSLDTDFWIGLDKIHRLTSIDTYELRVDLVFEGKPAFAHYSKFSVASEADNYRLSLGSYDGNAGNDLAVHNGMAFSTKDRDNDKHTENCAVLYSGAWWYNACHHSNLNGVWGEVAFGKGPNWQSLTGVYDAPSLTEMKIRRIKN